MMVKHVDPISAAILAGGQSRRMGQDKALLRLGDRPFLQRVIDRARTIADDIFVVASERPEYAQFGFRVVPDRFPGAGSLGGIYTAVAEAQHHHCLVLACDMPFVNVPFLTYLAAVPRDYDVLVPTLPAERSDQGGQETLETLHAIYSKDCLPSMEQRLRAGRYKIVGFFDDVRVERVPEEVVRRYDPDCLSFFNANTPDQFAWAQTRLKAEERGGQLPPPPP